MSAMFGSACKGPFLLVNKTFFCVDSLILAISLVILAHNFVNERRANSKFYFLNTLHKKVITRIQINAFCGQRLTEMSRLSKKILGVL